MFREFKAFLLKQNAMALAVGVIIGAAVGKVVSSLVENVINPVIGLMLPGGSWREAAIPLRTHIDPKTNLPVVDRITYGQFLGAVIDFVIIALVVYVITKTLLPKPGEAPPTKACPQCGEIIPAAATRCRACTQPVP